MEQILRESLKRGRGYLKLRQEAKHSSPVRNPELR